MQVVFQTSVNPVRQRTQEMVRDSLGAIGVAVEMKRVRGDDFFSSDPQQTQSINHFYADLQAYNIGNESPRSGDLHALVDLQRNCHTGRIAGKNRTMPAIATLNTIAYGKRLLKNWITKNAPDYFNRWMSS